MGNSRWTTELQAAQQAAKQAGGLLMEWAGRFTVAAKGVNDLVTEADHAAQQRICSLLAKQFPQDAVQAEEGDQQDATARGRCWIIDPLDGTTNYVHEFPFFCVSIALALDGEPVVGVVYNPVSQEMFSAAPDVGARCNGRPLQVSTTPRLSESLVCAGIASSQQQRADACDVLAHISTRARSARRLGSAALTLAFLAAGRLDAYWAETLNAWDAAAGVALVCASGGQVTNLHDSRYNLYTPDILATNGLVHAELAGEIRACRRQKVQ